MKLAGIDIGSNAARLLVAEVKQQPENGEISIRKIKLYRVPVRLGGDAFTLGKISQKNTERLIKAMRAFQLLMEIYEVEAYRACSTSAMREASNSTEIVAAVRASTGIDINIIDGQEEARLIFSNKLSEQASLDSRFQHLYVDVGGGSTEISLLRGDEVVQSRSFKIGTLRIFKEKVKQSTWDEMEKWLEKRIRPKLPLTIIGSGGNINRIFKRSGNLAHQPLMIEDLRKEFDLLSALSIEDRIYIQDLNDDRAEVIVPALQIFLFVMDHTGVRQVVVPKIGLSDGIVRMLYQTQAT